MKFEKLGLLAIVSEVKKCETTDQLSKLESELADEFKQRINSANNWIEKSKAELLKKQCTAIVSDHRRFILSLPAFRKTQSDYKLGQAIGKGQN